MIVTLISDKRKHHDQDQVIFYGKKVVKKQMFKVIYGNCK